MAQEFSQPDNTIVLRLGMEVDTSVLHIMDVDGQLVFTMPTKGDNQHRLLDVKGHRVENKLRELEEVLRFYADPASYRNRIGADTRITRPIYEDDGRRARAILRKYEAEAK